MPNTSIEARDYTVQTWGDEWLEKVALLNAAPHTVGGVSQQPQSATSTPDSDASGRPHG